MLSQDHHRQLPLKHQIHDKANQEAIGLTQSLHEECGQGRCKEALPAYKRAFIFKLSLFRKKNRSRGQLLKSKTDICNIFIFSIEFCNFVKWTSFNTFLLNGYDNGDISIAYRY